ncbi:MAG: hypothetical protein E7289_02475 [Lachnospiraceae bacterium]|nr:hypothetical protein [Lachnospiraceae bacterium]
MSRKEEIYKPALVGKNIPILTLDNKWHRLFTQTEISPEIKLKEQELNDLLKRQGKLNNECKKLRSIKTKLRDEIVSLMDGGNESSAAQKKQEENKKLIEDCNERLEADQDELLDIEKEISTVNYELMLLSMEVCYEAIRDNTAEIEQIDKWINQMRIDLKKNVVRKQEKEVYNQNLYSYMHDIFGPEVIEIFDMKYNPAEKAPKTAGDKKS